MVHRKNLLLVIAVLGIGAIVAALALRYHIAKVKAARLEQFPAIAPYFPPGPNLDTDVSHEPRINNPPPSLLAADARLGNQLAYKATGR